MTDFQTGLLLLAVGFPTVFLILFLVIGLGKGLIQFVNRFLTEEPAQVVPTTRMDAVDARQLAVLTAAVQTATEGTGRIVRIEKL